MKAEQEVITGLDRLLSVREAARAMGVSKHNIWEAVQAGKLRAIRFGKRSLLFRVEALNAWARSQEATRE